MATDTGHLDLPATVTRLDCPNGSTVYVVGTAHFSKDSVDDVRSTITRVRPQAVVLELCQERQMLLHFSEEQILNEARTMTFAKMRSFIRRDGLVVGVTQSIFLKLSAQLTEQLGVAPGGEFRAGFEEAQKMDASIILGDRRIGLTFRRALAALSLWQRVRFGLALLSSLTSDLSITPAEVERLKDRDMVTLLTGELSTEFPALSRVLVTERDAILAFSLMTAANCAHPPYGPPVTVVGVVGMGHVAGVEKHWLSSVNVRELHTLVPPSRSMRLFHAGVRATWLGVKVGIVLACVAGAYFTARRLGLWLLPSRGNS